jgi:twinkle protein
MNPREISERLSGKTDAVVRHLLPNGRIDGQEWRVGSIHGEEGKSLGVRLTGDKTGVWSDFATGESGDLLDLWVKTKGVNLSDAMQEAKSFLGISDTRFHGHRSKQYKSPKMPTCKAVKSNSSVFKYLTEERGLTRETIAAFKVAESCDSIIFPFIHDDKVVMVKRLMLERKNGKKDIRPTSSEQEPCLFGWQAIPDDTRSVSICEGEIDAMSLHQLGFPALSVPFGGGTGAKHNWIENEYDRLERFDEIYLCMDNDAGGNAAIEEIASRLGRHRCRIVQLPCKDANDFLKSGKDTFDLAKHFNDAKTMDPVELKPASHFQDDIIREFYPPDNASLGFFSPWNKVGNKLMHRPGEVTILAGVNGHGKSEGTGHIVLDAIKQGVKACIASLEFKPAKWLYRLTRQGAGIQEPSVPYIQAIQEWFGDRLWVFDVVGTAKADKIIEVFEYACRRYGLKLFVIDNLSKLDIGLDNYDKQRDFVDQLTDFAKDHDCHVILVAHSRKAFDDSNAGGKFDVKGSGAITDLADTVLIWWRNRPKEEKVRKAANNVDSSILEKPDAVVRCEKQRNGEEEPVICLWFDKASHQFLPSYKAKPKRYVEFSVKRFKGEAAL